MTKKMKDTSKCKEWERQRRDRLNTAFDGLAQLLPFYDPAKTMTKIDILEKSAQFIKEIRLTNSRLLVEKCQPQETGKKVHQLQEEVNKLIIRVRQLTALLKQANITIPLGPSIKLLGKKRRKWSSKLISQEIENADPSKGGNISRRRKTTVSKLKCTVRKNHGATTGSPSVPTEKETNVCGAAAESAPGNQVDSNETDNIGGGIVQKQQSTSGQSETSKDCKIVLPAKKPAASSSSKSKSVVPLTPSNLQNAQPIISTGMPVTINLSSTLTPVTFSGQVGFQNLSLQQLRPTIFLTTPITCSLPQSSSAVNQFGANTTSKTNDASLSILPKLIVPSCSLQKIPIKCIRKPLPRKKFKPRGNSKKRLELLAKKACESSKQVEIGVKEAVVNSKEPTESSTIKESTIQRRSPSPELIDISKDIEDERPDANSEADKRSTVQGTLTTTAQPAEGPQISQNGEPSAELQEKVSAVIETEKESNAGPTPEHDKVSNVQSTSPLAASYTCAKNRQSNAIDGQPGINDISSGVEKTLASAEELDSNASEVQQVETPCSRSVEELTLAPQVGEAETPQQTATSNSHPIESATSAEESTSTSSKLNQIAQNEKQKPASKAATIPATSAQSSADLGRLLEEEDVSLSSEDKISECIARSIGLIDEHPVCSSELMELTTEWTSVVNSHLAAKSPISPTQMFLSMFPLLPRDSLLGDNVFGQKTNTGLLGCGRPSFAINSVLLENDTASGSATPSSIGMGEPILTGLDSAPYSWSQTQLGESSSVQSKFNSIFTPQRPNKRSLAESRNPETVSNSKSTKQTREDKQNTNTGNSCVFTALHPVSTSAGSKQADSSRRKSNSASGQQSNEEVQSLKQFQLPSSDVPGQTLSKPIANKRSRKPATAKANIKAADNIRVAMKSPTSSDAASKSKTQRVSEHSETRRTNHLPMQSPRESHSHPQPQPFVITSPKGSGCEKVSQFMPFRSSAQQRSSSSFSPSGQTKKSLGDTAASSTKSSTSTAFLPSLSHPNVPFELFRPAISGFPTSSHVSRRKDGETDTHGGHQFLAHGDTNQPFIHLLDQPSQYNAHPYDDGQDGLSTGAAQPAPARFQQASGGAQTSTNYPVTTSQCNQTQVPGFQSCEAGSGSSKPPSQPLNTSSYNLDVNSAKAGQKSSKVSQHFPFYLTEPSFQKRNEGFPHRSDYTIGTNYAYQQQGPPNNSNHAQGSSSQNQQPTYFAQPQVQTQSLYQPVAVSSSAPRHSVVYNQAYSERNNSNSQSSSVKSGHSQPGCSSANYFDQPNALVQYASSIHPPQHGSSFRTLVDSQPCPSTENSSNSTSRFVPPFANQRHPTVNWMTDPSGTNYSNMPTATSNKKASRNSSHSSHNPFSVSTLMGSNATAAGAGNDSYCTEAIIRKTTSNWNNFQGNPSTSQISVSKPEVSVASARSATVTNYNAPFQPAHAHHQHQQPQSSPQSQSHSHSHFAGGSQFNYFENSSLSMDHGAQTHYLSTPAPVTKASTTTPQIFLQQHPLSAPSAPHPDSHTHTHGHQQHHHCSHPPSSSSVTNFNLSTIFPEINDKRLNSSSTSSYNVSGPGGQDHRHGGSQAQSQTHSHSHSHHHPGGNSGNPPQQQQQQTSVNQANNFSYFVNNLTPK